MANTDTEMKLLLDAGVFINAEIGEYTTRAETVRWGSSSQSREIPGIVRKPLAKDPSFQVERDALFTVGRLIREGRVTAYKYTEVAAELSRASNPVAVTALADCKIMHCEPAIHRSKFRQTRNFVETLNKGGKKDRNEGRMPSYFNQIPTLSWFISLTPADVSLILQHAAELQLSPFEIQSFRELEWFQILCNRSGSSENYVDVFHLWTAERNDLMLLTLDRGIKKLVSRVNSEKSPPVTMRTKVLSPNDLLVELGITERDPVPLESGKFYRLHELPSFQG